jgi:hypothetical protein
MKNAAGSNARGGHELKPAAVIPGEGVTRWLIHCNRYASWEILAFPVPTGSKRIERPCRVPAVAALTHSYGSRASFLHIE